MKNQFSKKALATNFHQSITTQDSNFDPSVIKMVRGNELKFGENLLIPLKTDTELDVILSTDGGLMPATNMILVGAPGAGKTTIALDILMNLTKQGYKTLFISAEMDEIAYYKYCRRLDEIGNVPVLFLNNYTFQLKNVLEYVFDQGYDVICIDSIAEVISSLQEVYGITQTLAEKWILALQQKHKKGENKFGYYTSFINIQQVTKQGEFIGSNRLKHMMDAMLHLDVSRDQLERTMHFSKNRDCDKNFKIFFNIINNKVYYSYELTE
jgi:DNA repair protein RadA/Sms